MSDAGFQLVSLIQAHRAESLGPFLRKLARASVAAGAITMAACSGSHVDMDGGAPDATAQRDANMPPVDAGAGDAGSSDAGATDAGPGPTDAGLTDSGPTDAGLTDSGPTDAGLTDAGLTDAGLTDAGLTDAGLTDAGLTDAGSDGGTVAWDEPNCDDDGWRAVHGLSLDASPDYLDAMNNSFGGAFVIDSIGTACDTASDTTTCMAELDALAPFGRALRTTTGDLVELHSTEAEVLSLLGSIDTPEEALLRVWHQGYDVYCGDAERVAVRRVGDHFEVRATRMVADCDPVTVNGYELQVDSDGTITVLSEWEISSTPGVCVGRRPEGLRATSRPMDPSVGAWLAETAFLEASAVHAFRVLADELTALGAPTDLVRDARAAAADEVRHADVMKSVAARYGANTPEPQIEARPHRSPFAMAMDNATEGCVRETFGALLGHHQALAATDPQLRSAMAVIAEDETRHATLSWRIAAWLEPLLTEAQQAQVEAARQQAVHTLRAEMSRDAWPGLAKTVGLPKPSEAIALVDSLQAAIWN